MSPAATAPRSAAPGAPGLNDFTVQVATPNGSGSQSSNAVLLRTLFQMGIPVSGKNLFPSNIAGLPTWYTVRASRDGHVARSARVDLLVAMNPETADGDLAPLAPGTPVVHDAALPPGGSRPALDLYPVPFDALVAPISGEARLRRLLRNMVYVGTLARLLELELPEVERAVARVFAGRARAIEQNVAAARAGFDHAAGFGHRPAFGARRLDATRGKILVDGNTAAALGSLFAGVTVLAWYPITPSSSLAEGLIAALGRHRRAPDGAATYAVVQAEDELAALGMVLGAGWAGARAMTATSGPGLSLMAELAGLGYYAEVPAVVWDVQRGGPSTGLPTRTSQGDLLAAALLSHGDTRHLLLLPGSVEECFTMAGEAFELAERFQTPVFVLSDLDLGMNTWMADPFPYPERPLDRGKVLDRAELERRGGFARYRDVDGDGIGWRTLPGTEHPGAAYFTRGSGHDERAAYSERADDYERNLARLARKIDGARGALPAPELGGDGRAPVGILSFGSSRPAVAEARAQLAAEAGIAADALRVRGWPLSPSVAGWIAAHQRVYVVEQNRDAQLLGLLRLDLDPALLGRLRPVARITGLPLDARSISDEIRAQEERR